MRKNVEYLCTDILIVAFVMCMTDSKKAWGFRVLNQDQSRRNHTRSVHLFFYLIRGTGVQCEENLQVSCYNSKFLERNFIKHIKYFVIQRRQFVLCRGNFLTFWNLIFHFRHLKNPLFWSCPKHYKKLRGFSPQANYTDRATAACRRS
jgi:K+-transporting ATPase A subunit